MATLLKQYIPIYYTYCIAFIVFLLAGGIHTVYAQTNLVPNPGFETYSACPTGQNQLSDATGWFNPLNADSSAPDYYNACSNACSGCVSVPQNAMGYQMAHGGSAYAGIYLLNYTAGTARDPYREYVACKLARPLTCNIQYQLTYYAAAADSGLCTSSIQALFTTGKPNSKAHNLINYTPQVENSYYNYIKDTSRSGVNVEWTTITGTYTAAGGETYLIIGNFNNDGNSNTLIPTDTLQQKTHAYVYIDDVSLIAISSDSCGSVNAAPPITLPNAFTPNHDNKNDTWHLLSSTVFTSFDLKVYNRYGSVVYATTDARFAWDGTYGSIPLPQGDYVWMVSYQVEGQRGTFSSKGDVTILR